jgi:hypothetical protein
MYHRQKRSCDDGGGIAGLAPAADAAFACYGHPVRQTSTGFSIAAIQGEENGTPEVPPGLPSELLETKTGRRGG